MQDTPIGWKVQLCIGATLLVMAMAAMTVDVINNYQYGASVSYQMAAVMVIAAFGVVAIPAAASIVGLSGHLKLTTAICVALTVWSAINAYTKEQGVDILAAQNKREHYNSAKLDAKRAREILNRISELGEVDALAKTSSEAEINFKKSCRHTWADACKQAEAERKMANDRLSAARTRDAAKQDLAKAEAMKSGGDAEASMLATVITGYSGSEPELIAKYIAMTLTGLGIAATQLVALLGGYASSLIAGAIKKRPLKPVKAKRAAPTTGGGSKEPLRSNVVQLDAARNSVRGWLNASAKAGGNIRGGDALKSYKRYAGKMASNMTGSELREILSSILPGGAVKQSTSGYSISGLSLKVISGRKAATL